MAYNEELILNDLSSRGELILEAAKNLFLKHGYAQTSLEMIIAEAGGSRRSIYNEFGNKQGLLTSVIQQQVLIHTASVASIKLIQLAPRDALREMCFRFVKGIVSDTIVSLYRLVLQVVPKLPEIGVLVYERGPLKGMKPLTDYLVQLDRENFISIDDPLFATQILMEMVKGRLHFKALLLPNKEITDENIQQQVDKAVDLFLKAYHPDS
jgi:TetR/AcrR family transcriptional repressor of mexJK operon